MKEENNDIDIEMNENDEVMNNEDGLKEYSSN